MPESQPASSPKHEVVLSGLAADASPVALIKLLMKRCFLSPESAKERVDAIRAADPQSFGFETREAADAFLGEARALGAGSPGA